jgi:hypothetical protein
MLSPGVFDEPFWSLDGRKSGSAGEDNTVKLR